MSRQVGSKCYGGSRRGFSSRSLGGFGKPESKCSYSSYPLLKSLEIDESLGSRTISDLSAGRQYYRNGGYGGGRSGAITRSGGGIQNVHVPLLKPAYIQLDPEIPYVKTQEKEQLKILNDEFASFIDKVQCLEQQNKVLSTKWMLLQQQSQKGLTKNLGADYESHIRELKWELDTATSEKNALETELYKVQQHTEHSKRMYEEEIGRRMAAENEFVVLKEEVDSVYLETGKLRSEVENLTGEIDFLSKIFQEEVSQLQSFGENTSLVVPMDNSRHLDMENIIPEIESQYKLIVQRSRAEAESELQKKYEELQSKAGEYGSTLQVSQRELTQLTHQKTRLQNEVDNLKRQVAKLESDIEKAEEKGDSVVNDTVSQLNQFSTALQTNKEELASLVKGYHQLLNEKLALDIEINMYRGLLEGEERRLNESSSVLL